MDSPLIVYDTRTKNVKRFVDKLGLRALCLRNIETIDESFILITYTDKFGEVPVTTQSFLEINHHLLMGVSASGNRRWKDNYAKAADVISEQYKVPIISKFELSGNVNDIKTFIERIDHFGYSINGKYELLRA